MAKTKTVKAATPAKTLNIGKTLRKGTLAYIGLYGTAYATVQTRAKARITQVKSSTDGLFDTLVKRGEVIEAQAGSALKTAQSKAVATYGAGTEKLRDVMPTASNDRVSELEAEVATLNKKIATLAKKTAAAKPTTKAAMKTEKSAKAA